jgi:hypothetical protein
VGEKTVYGREEKTGFKNAKKIFFSVFASICLFVRIFATPKKSKQN